MNDVQLFLVGGFVRDHLLGVVSKDVDFSVVAPSFEAMEQWLKDNGFEVFVSSPQFFTLRARGPKGFTFAGFEFGNMTFDFVWARQDGPYSDGRRPDWVVRGSLLDDLKRRDFTINAMAIRENGNLIDPFGGEEHLRLGIITTVGDPNERFREDALRIVRAVRFAITKDFQINDSTAMAMRRNMELLDDTAAERIREELSKAFSHNWARSIFTIVHDWPGLITVMDMHDIRLKPTMEK